jgi:RNA polymerase sigma factor (sigma-70 family)
MARGHARLLATQTDERLLELMQQGHERAFEAIVVRYRRGLLAYCRRLGLPDARAEDALQQTFLKAWIAIEGGAQVRALSPWLYRIAHNAAVNVIRGSRDELAWEPNGALMELLAAPESQPEQAGEARQALTQLAELPSMQRDAILLSAVEGRSHEEVARALGITSGAVRGLIYRARTALRAAAAALTPAPLINWASGAAGRAAPGAARLAELTGAAGGADAGGVLLKVAAVAGSALLAAGVVLVPLHGHHAATRARGDLDAAGTQAHGELITRERGHVSSTAARDVASTWVSSAPPPAAPAAHARTPLSASVLTPATVHTKSTPAPAAPGVPSAGGGAGGQGTPTSTTVAPATATASTATSPTASVSESAGGESAGGSASGSGGSGSGAGGGSGSPQPPEGNKPQPPGGDGSEGTDDGRGDDSGGSESAEREREAASEKAEQEAEVAHELAQREQEAAQEHEAGKDS